MSSVRFQCPSCGAVHTMPDSAQGQKGSCGRCHQRLLVPGSPKPIARTVLARELPPKETPSLLPPTTLHTTPEVPVAPPSRRSFRLTVVGSLCAIALGVMGLACLGVVVTVMPKKAATLVEKGALTVPEDRPEPQGDAEKIVAAWVKKNSPDDGNVEFLRWGPHLRRDEVRAWLKEAGMAANADNTDPAGWTHADVVVRVCYRHFGPKRPGWDERRIETRDWLIPVGGRPSAVVSIQLGDPNVHFLLANENGDNWKRVCRKKTMAEAAQLRGR